MPDEVSAAIFMNAHILQNNQSIAQQAPAQATSLIKQEADKSHGYWFREVLSYEAVKHNFFPVRMTGSSPVVCLSGVQSLTPYVHTQRLPSSLAIFCILS